MHIVVCVKMVPDTTLVQIDPVTNTLVREGVPFITNPFDTHALEEALRIKDRYGSRVTTISMGPPTAERVLRRALALGSDRAILLSDRAFGGADTLATSRVLAAAIEKIANEEPVDLVFCGMQTIDGDTAQVGPGIAEHLGISQVTYVQRVVSVSDKAIQVERSFEAGYEVIETPLPAVLTIDKAANVPRLPSMMGTMKALRKEIRTLTSGDIDVRPELLGMEGSPTRVKRTFTPQPRKGGRMLQGEMEDMLKELVQILREEKIV